MAGTTINPTFSIIVPVFNAEKTIERCIRSVLSQTFSDFELLLIDDGSSDESLSLCKKYESSDSRIRVFSQENKGVSAARNIGLENATGAWCVFVDSDDWLEENHLEKLSEESADITWTGYKMYDENGAELSRRTVEPLFAEGNAVQDAILALRQEKNFFAIIWTKKFRTEIIKSNSIRFPENVCICEDIIFTWQYLQYAKSISVISETTYNYTFRNGSLSHKKDNLANYWQFVKEYLQLVQNISFREDVVSTLKNDAAEKLYGTLYSAFRPFLKNGLELRKTALRDAMYAKYTLQMTGGGGFAEIFMFLISCALCDGGSRSSSES